MSYGYLSKAVGVVGSGDISDVYLSVIARSPATILTSLASMNFSSAERQAQRFGGKAVSFDAMLDDDSIELIVNLTPAAAHFEVSSRILESGKHLYTEKPLASSLAQAEDLVTLAEAKNLRIGSAPDTFFGAGHQLAREILESDKLGRPVCGAAFSGHPGIEMFHPNPAHFYQPGSETPYEIGPYFLAQLVNLLGPVRWVAAHAAEGVDRRSTKIGPRVGVSFPVGVPTSYNAVLAFASGVSMTFTASLDVLRSERKPLELFCTGGSLMFVDIDFFGAVPRVAVAGKDWQEPSVAGRPFSIPNITGITGVPLADYRGVGLIDMVVAMHENRPHRAGPDIVLHVVEVLQAIVAAGTEGAEFSIRTTCERPAPVSPAADALLVELMPSPFPISS